MNKIEGILKNQKFEARGVVSSVPSGPSWFRDRIALDTFVSEQQLRLVVGPFQFVLAAEPDRGKPALWALPGGARATTAQLLDLARRSEWKRPAQIQVAIRRAHDNDIRRLRAALIVSQETHGE